MKKTTTALMSAILVLSVCVFDSCVLEKGWIEDFKTNGKVNFCPPGEDADITALEKFIYKDSDGNHQTCERDDCESSSECCDLPSDMADLFYKGFENGLCPDRYSCVPQGEGSDISYICDISRETVEVLNCGSTMTVCDGTCVNLDDNADHCGACGYRCADEGGTGILQYSCRSRKCVPKDCDTGYHLEGKTCVSDDEHSCHGVDCTSHLGWSSGTCNERGECAAESCHEGYHLNQVGTPFCEEDTKEHCGSPDNVCTLREGAALMDCYQGACVVSKCDTKNYHWNQQQTECIANSVEECGAFNVNCLTYPGWNPNDPENRCGLNDDGLVSCIANSCLPEYHIYTGQNSPCEHDDIYNCGTHDNPCGSGEVCKAGVCDMSCGTGLDICNGNCTDISNNSQNCGECGHECTETDVANASVFICENKVCKALLCKPGYHLFEGSCEKNSTENCGERGRVCDASVIGGGSTFSCDDGTCKVEKCVSGFHVFNNTCEEDSASNCGNHGTTCSAPNTTPSCKNGACNYSCNKGYDDCDKNMSNGCEVNLYNYGMTNCTTCDSSRSFEKCGKYGSLPLCVKLGVPCSNCNNNSPTVIHPGESNCKQYCNNPNGKGGSYSYSGDNWYNVKVCSPGDYCYLNSYGDQNVKCSRP
ncbi:MAG: hypothetical protein J6A01_00835 [Proteobacteria bacterium]|nr:hypothetical protein [Pseudomonadota bacterium]